jgi:ABC-type uncharacterized transport system substrate-binding protein
VYLPADSFLISEAKLLGAELRAAKIRSIAAVETYVDHGALLGVVPQYRELGRAAAAIVHRHLNGQRLQEMAVQVDPEPVVKINAATSRALGVAIPDTLRRRALMVE